MKQAGDLNSTKRIGGQEDIGGNFSETGSMSSLQKRKPHPRPTQTGATLTVIPAPIASSSGTNILLI